MNADGTVASGIMGFEKVGNGAFISNNGIVNIIDSVIADNIAVGHGGVIGNNTTGKLKVENSIFKNNKTNNGGAVNGGAIWNNFGEIEEIKNTQFIGNVAGNQGGAIFSNALATITNSRFIGNYTE